MHSSPLLIMVNCKICQLPLEKHLENLFDDRYGYPDIFNIYCCHNCGLYQTVPTLTPEKISELYSNYYPRQNFSAQSIKQNFQPESSKANELKNWFNGNHRIQYLLPPGQGKILEIGCGDGRAILQLQALGYDVYGLEVDINVKPLADQLNLKVEISTIENCTWPNNFFDYIIANQLIEHLIDLDSFFLKVNNLLKSNGQIIISTPNGQSLARCLLKTRWLNWHLPYHQQIFNKKSLSLLASKYGLKVKKIKTVSPLSWSLHQWAVIKKPAIMGLKSPYWNKTPLNLTNQSNNATIKSRSLKLIVFKSVCFLLNVINRLIDWTGHGDCLIIYLKKQL